MKTAQIKFPQRGFSPIFIFVGVAILVVVGLLITKGNLNKIPVINQQVSNQNLTQKTTQTDSSLKSIFSTIEGAYNGSIPWINVNDKAAFQFYPKELKGLVLPYVSTNHDKDYNPVTAFRLTESVSIPLKNSYITYYVIPDLLKDKFKLSDTDSRLAIKLQVYEFDRQLSEKEKEIIVKGENFTCSNDESKTETTSFTNEQVAIYFCNANLTDKQKAQIARGRVFDKFYEVYFINRNVLVALGVDSRYIDSPQDYLADYLSKIFNTNSTLFITQDQIQSIEESRKFEEWRSETFDKK